MKNEKIHHTSANMDSDFYDSLVKTSIEFNISKQKIFKDLIQIVSQNTNCGIITGILTEYQDHCPENWNIFNYSLDAKEIEFFGKARQKYKISISKLAFMGFVLFWKLLLYIYLDRLKISNKSYKIENNISYYKKTVKFVNEFKNRLNIILKE